MHNIANKDKCKGIIEKNLIERINCNDKYIKVEKEEYIDKCKIVHAKSITKSTTCSCCNKQIKRFKGYRSKRILLGEVNRKLLKINLKQKMYYCEDCNCCTVEQIMVDKYRRRSKEVTNNMIEMLIEKSNYSCIARLHGVSRQTVINWFDDYELDKPDKNDLRVIGIDEVNFMKTDKSKYQCIIYNHETGEVADIIKTRFKDDILNVLKDIAPNLETITQDCWATYKNVAKEINPNALVVLDLFHIVRYVNWDYNKGRKIIAEITNIKTVKYWRLLCKNSSKLDDKGREKVKSIIENQKELAILYRAKEIGYSAFTSTCQKEFLKKVYRFLKYLEENNITSYFSRLLSVLNNWSEEVLNIYKYREFSNGKIEQANSKMKDLKRNARGFRNFERSKKLALLVINNKVA